MGSNVKNIYRQYEFITRVFKWPLSELKRLTRREREFWIAVTEQRIRAETGHVVS